MPHIRISELTILTIVECMYGFLEDVLDFFRSFQSSVPKELCAGQMIANFILFLGIHLNESFLPWTKISWDVDHVAVLHNMVDIIIDRPKTNLHLILPEGI